MWDSSSEGLVQDEIKHMHKAVPVKIRLPLFLHS